MSITIDASAFYAMCKDLARMSGNDIKPIIKAQAGALIEVCIRETVKQSGRAVERRIEAKNRRFEIPGQVVVTRNKKDGKWWMQDKSNLRSGYKGARPELRGTFAYHDMDKHWSDRRWGRFVMIKAMMQESLITKKEHGKMIALRAASWLQCAEDIGIGTQIKAQDAVRNAITLKRKKAPKMGRGSEVAEKDAYCIELNNSSNLLVKAVDGIDGAKILEGAFRIRSAAFSRDLKKGTFADIEQRAKRYPGVFTT